MDDYFLDKLVLTSCGPKPVCILRLHYGTEENTYERHSISYHSGGIIVDTQSIIAELEGERERLNRAIAALQGTGTGGGMRARGLRRWFVKSVSLV
jgi:hypothetical protein